MSIAKRELFESRPKMFITKVMVTNIAFGVEKGIEDQKHAMLWLFSYLFLLRVPSEAIV